MPRRTNKARLPDIPIPLILAAAFVPLYLFVFGYFATSLYNFSGLNQAINGLLRAQISVLAIVFSIVILGVQLSATRYSPRIVVLFKDDVLLRFVVAQCLIRFHRCIQD